MRTLSQELVAANEKKALKIWHSLVTAMNIVDCDVRDLIELLAAANCKMNVVFIEVLCLNNIYSVMRLQNITCVILSLDVL